MPMFNGKFILASTLPVSNPLSISKDSVVLTSEAHSINFTGAGVSASSDPSGNVTVNIPGSSGSSLTVNSNAGIDTINFNTSRFTVLPDSPGTISIDATTSMISGVGGFSGSGSILPPVPFSLLAFQIGFLLSEINPGEIIISIDNQPNQVWYNSTLLGEENPLLGLKLNFTGAGVTVTSNSTNSFDVNIPGGGGSAPDATTTSKGIVQLAGDLDGTADSPSVPGLANKINKTGDFVSGTYVYNGVPTAPLTLARTTITSNDARIYLENAQGALIDKTLDLMPGIFYLTTNSASGSDYTYTSTSISSSGFNYDYSNSTSGVTKVVSILLAPSGSSIEVDGTPYLATQGKNIATKQYVDNSISSAISYIPNDTLYSKRSIIPVSGTTALFSNGMGSSGTNWSIGAGTSLSSTPTNTGARSRAIRSRLSSSGSSSSYCSIGSNSTYPLCSITFGWKLTISFGYGDASFNASTRSFYGLIEGGIPAMGGQPSALINMIGIGNDATPDGSVRDANLYMMCNDSTGTATKINLGANFPANRDAASASQDWIVVELYNAPASSIVKYKVTNLANGATAQGNFSSNLPASSVMLGPALVRANGTISSTYVMEFGEIAVWTNG